MSGLDLLRVVIVASAWVTFAPQAVRARRDVRGLALPTWAGFVATSTAWVVYGLVVDDPLQWIVNGPVVLAVLVVVRAAWPAATSRQRRTAVLFAVGVLVASVGAAAGLGVVGAAAVAICVTLVQLTPQAVAVVRDPDPSGVSVATWLIAGGNQLLWIAYGALDGQPAIVVNATVFSSIALLIALLTVARRRAALSVG